MIVYVWLEVKQMYDLLFEEKKQEEMKQFFVNLASSGNIKKYKKKELIDIEGYEFVGIVLEGTVKQTLYSPQGLEKSLFFLKRGEIFGEMDYFTQSKCELIVKAVEASEVAIINKKALEQALRESPKNYEFFIHSMVRKYRITLFQMKSMVFNKSIKRLADTLLRLSYQDSTKKDDKTVLNRIFTHQELAELIGCSRITVTNDLNELKKMKLITVKNKEISIDSLKNLENYLQDDD